MAYEKVRPRQSCERVTAFARTNELDAGRARALRRERAGRLLFHLDPTSRKVRVFPGGLFVPPRPASGRRCPWSIVLRQGTEQAANRLPRNSPPKEGKKRGRENERAHAGVVVVADVVVNEGACWFLLHASVETSNGSPHWSAQQAGALLPVPVCAYYCKSYAYST